MDTLEMALASVRKPEIFHSDQGCEFTTAEYVAMLQAEGIRISWYASSNCCDNILMERLWRTSKYGKVYLGTYSDGGEAISAWLNCHGNMAM